MQILGRSTQEVTGSNPVSRDNRRLFVIKTRSLLSFHSLLNSSFCEKMAHVEDIFNRDIFRDAEFHLFAYPTPKNKSRSQ
jgi:hypothetical protein